MSKSVKSVSKAASSAVKSVSGGVSKIAQGKIGEGLGDIGQAAARVGLDTATGGNKDLADKLSGGALSAAEGAARGNSEDLVRLGVTAGAATVAGPAGAYAANQGFALGGAQGGLTAALGGVGIPGAGLIAEALTNAVGSGSRVSPSSAPVLGYEDFSSVGSVPAPGGSGNTFLIMGAAFMGLLLIVVLFLSFRGKK